MTGNSNKCLKLHLSHNLPRHTSYNEPAGDMNTVIFPSHDYTWNHTPPWQRYLSLRSECIVTPCHALFISPCAYTATNWRQVRFKPMLLMGKNVWYVLALVPPPFYIWPSVLYAAAPPDLSACVPIKHLSSVCIYCLNSRGRVSAVASVSSCLKRTEIHRWPRRK